MIQHNLQHTARDEHIGVVLLTSSLERGGAERQVVELANGLDDSRFRVTVCSLSNENPLAADLRDTNERFVVLPKTRKFDLALIARTARLLASLKTAVVHSFMFDAEIVGRLAGRLARVPAVICSNRCPHLGRARFKRWVARFTEPCFDVMIANSWAGFEYERDHQRVDAAKLCVIPNGVDTEVFHPGEAIELRREFDIPPAAPVIGMFAHFRGNKDHATLIEAAAMVLKKHHDARFLLVGGSDGDHENSLHGKTRAAVSRLDIADRVIFAGARSDIPELCRLIDIKVLSTHFEGTPNVVLEAMASGRPVIASNVSDNARLIIDGRTGFVVPPRDASAMADRIARLIADPALRRDMGAAGRLRAEEEYSVEALSRRTSDVYLSVLRQKGCFDARSPMLAAARSEAG